MKKKLLLGLGSLLAIATPVVTVVSCGVDEDKVEHVFEASDVKHNGSTLTATTLTVRTDANGAAVHYNLVDGGFGATDAKDLAKTVHYFLDDAGVTSIPANTLTVVVGGESVTLTTSTEITNLIDALSKLFEGEFAAPAATA